MRSDSVTEPRHNPVRPQQRGEERRSRLLEALAARLKTQSLAEVSIADVTDEAGLGRSAFYHYFSGKHEAVTHLLSDIFFDHVTAVTEIVSAPGDPRDIISRSLRLIVESWCEEKTLYLAMFDARDADPATRQIWTNWLHGYQEFTAAYIIDNRTAPGADPHDLAHALIAMNEQVLERLLRSGAGRAAAQRAHATLLDVWASTIFGKES